MGKKKEVERKKIIKIPFITQPPVVKADFPRFPELYLQYIENPKKVNKDSVYIPYTDQVIRDDRRHDGRRDDGRREDKHRDRSDREKSKRSDRRQDDRRHEDRRHDDRRHDDRSKSDRDKDDRKNEDRRNEDRRKSKRKSKSDGGRDDNRKDNDKRKSKSDRYVSLGDIEKHENLDKLLKKSKSSHRSPRKSPQKKSKDNLENYMKKNRVSIHSKSKSDRKENKKPPPINEIEANATQGKFKNLNRIAQKDMSTETLKRELLFKIEIMKKQYPNLGLPTYTMTNTVEQMRNTIDTSVKTIMLESTVTKYKRWFRIALLISEYFFTRILKMDYMTGSTQYHMKSMSEYDIMIIELGEKSYSEGSDWPVEIRLGMLALFNTALYGLSKKFDMPDLIALLSQFVKNGDVQEPKRMRGPSARVEDS